MAVVFGFSAAVLSFSILSSYVKTSLVVVAQKDIGQYSRIGPWDVCLSEMPEKAIMPSSCTRVEEVLGAYAVTKIVSGQIIAQGHIVSGKDEIGVSFDIPSEERALLIPAVPEKACGGLIKPGDKVDVTYVPKSREVADNGVIRGSSTILHEVRVIRLTFDSSSKEMNGVLVQVPPDVCEKMAYYIESGSLYLSLVPKEKAEENGAKKPEDGVLP